MALAVDFDGTLAHNGRVPREAIDALQRLKKSGRKAILVTGRLVESLRSEFPHFELFDLIVAENGALLYDPSGKATPLAQPPPAKFVEELRKRGVTPLEIGQVIVATWQPHEPIVLDVIRQFGLELQVIFNKGAVMVLPAGVTKASGLSAALEHFGLSAHNVAGVGDAENDHAFLALCELSAAVANALPSIKDAADVKLSGDHGHGVAELVDNLLESDCGTCPQPRSAGSILLGSAEGRDVSLDPYIPGITLVTGSSGAGKSTLTTAILERLIERKYQVCVVDPEGDYDLFEPIAKLGDVDHAPALSEIESILQTPGESVAINLLGIEKDSRPEFAAQLLGKLASMRAETGRPHWIVLDEAHHLLTFGREHEVIPKDVFGLLAVSTDASHFSKGFRNSVTCLVALGEDAQRALQDVAGQGAPRVSKFPEKKGLLWLREDPDNAKHFDITRPKQDLQRHRRKYASGDLAPDKSFYFRGSEGKLNLRAQNLNLFAQIAEGVDQETWLHHLKNGDIADWLEEKIGDDDLANVARGVEKADAKSSKERIIEEIRRRYTAPA